MSKSKRAQPREAAPLVDWAGVDTMQVDFDAAAVIFSQAQQLPPERPASRLSL